MQILAQSHAICSGKTTQLRIIAGKEEADEGTVLKAAANMKIAFLSQEFEVVGTRTLREEFVSVFGEQMAISARIEKVQVEICHTKIISFIGIEFSMSSSSVLLA